MTARKVPKIVLKVLAIFMVIGGVVRLLANRQTFQPFMIERYGFKKGDFPVTEGISERTIALPFHNNLSEQEVKIVCTELKACLDELK